MAFNMKAIQQMQSRLLKAQEQLQATTFEGTAGGGAVTVAINGKFEVTGVKLDKDVIDPEDPSMLEDMILAAAQDAFKKATEAQAKMMSQVTGGLGLPPGLL